MKIWVNQAAARPFTAEKPTATRAAQDSAMSLRSFLYVSRSAIALPAIRETVDAIVAQAQAHNARAGLTGALLFTGTHFAQILEGSGSEIDAMIARLSRDPRHQQMVIVSHQSILSRQFIGWALAYFGTAQFVSRPVAKLMECPSSDEARRGGEWIVNLMREFTLQAQGPGIGRGLAPIGVQPAHGTTIA